MSAYQVKMRDGTVRDFPETTRAGGSYSTTMRIEGAFVIFQDAHGKEVFLPESLIASIEKEPWRGW